MKIHDPIHLFALGYTLNDVKVNDVYFDDFWVTMATLKCVAHEFRWDERRGSWIAVISFPQDITSAWPREVDLHLKGIIKKKFKAVLKDEGTESAGPR